MKSHLADRRRNGPRPLVSRKNRQGSPVESGKGVVPRARKTLAVSSRLRSKFPRDAARRIISKARSSIGRSENSGASLRRSFLRRVGSWLDSVRYRHQNAQSGVHRGNVICHRTSIVKCKRGQREFVKAQFAPTGDLRGVKLQKPRSRCWGAWSFSTIGITAPIFSKVRVAESVGGATAADSFEKPKCGQEPPSSASPPPES